MKRSIALVIALLTALVAACFTGCVSVSEKYANADKYSAGDAGFSGSEVRYIDISWMSGSVTVTRGETDRVTVTETSSTELKDSQRVHTWLDGDTLRIHYCKSGEKFYGFKSINKKLSIQIPQDIELSGLSYDGSSGDLICESIAADEISAEASSGDIRLSDCSARTIDAEVSSGDITIVHKGEAEAISAEASSGDIEITAEKVGELEAEASSGDIELRVGEAVSVDAEASSGKVVLHLASMPADTDIETSSGSVKVYLPEGADFTADIDTSSGDIDTGIPLVKDGSRYTSGNGSNKLSIETSSGDIKLLAE